MKKFKTKRRHSKVIYFILILFLLIIFIYLSFKKLNQSYDGFINLLLNNSFYRKEKNTFVMKELVTNLNYLLPKKSFKEKEEKIKETKEMIYLYNTHDRETYQDGKNVIDASLSLQNNLSKLGISSFVEERKVSSFLDLGLGNYAVSRTFLEDAKKNNYQYYIDIHRDSVKNTKIDINQKSYAKILFVLGCDNPNYAKNKIIMEKMNYYLNENYQGLSKGILEKSGSGVDGIYNQDLGENVLLIEIGGIDNTFEEVNNSTEIIALMLYHLLGE